MRAQYPFGGMIVLTMLRITGPIDAVAMPF
jgi:hypothetical protein